MKSRVSQSIAFGLLAVAILVMCSNTWLAFLSVQALTESAHWVDHTWQVIDSLERVMDWLDEAETSNRGYLLSGNEDYLAPYEHAKAKLPGQLNAIAQLVVDNPPEVEAVDKLRDQVKSRMSLLEQDVEERRSGRPSPTRLQALAATGRPQMDRIRSLVAQMQQVEHSLLVRRAAVSSRDARRARTTVAFAGGVDLLLLLLVFRYVVIEHRQRRYADQTAERLEKLQSISDVALTGLKAGDLTKELLLRLRKVISADAVMLWMLRNGSISVEAASGLTVIPGSAILPAEGSPLDRAIQHNEVVILPDASSLPLPPGSLRDHTRSLLVVPLSISQPSAGLLAAGCRTIDAFDEHDAEILSVAASRISVALDRAKAYDAERQARREAEARAEEVRSLNAGLERRVVQRTAELESTNSELEAFSYSVSHDLRAPLRTVDGFSSALEEDYGKVLDAVGQDYLHRIRDGVQRMGHLIDSLLQLSRITRAELLEEPVNLSALAGAVVEELAAHNPDRSMVFAIQPDLKCIGDSRLLRSAFENLLGNAVKFTAREPEAHIELGRSGDAYFVRDNGAGFDMRYADRLFNAFSRLHGDREFQGSGIGLATVARIIGRHQGKIWAEGKVGHGATFWFTLGE